MSGFPDHFKLFVALNPHLPIGFNQESWEVPLSAAHTAELYKDGLTGSGTFMYEWKPGWDISS